MMNIDQLFANYEQVSDAPDAVSRLRRFVLNLAVRGRLVEQNPEDEPASELLKRILEEKACLMKAKKIKKSKVIPITSEDAPFSVPINWIWTRLGEIGDWGSGSTPARSNPDLYGGGVTWIKSGELNDNINLMDSEETVTELAVKKGSFRVNQPGDVLIAMYGATIGKLAILGNTAVTNQAVCGCTPFNGVLNHFLFFFLLAQRKEFHATSEGGAQPNISKLKIVQTPFPLPPLEEQHRIVAKVNELMSLCDQLEEKQLGWEAKRNLLTTVSLNRLNIPNLDKTTFQSHVNFALDNFTSLTTRPRQIKELLQTIFNLAVSGKLVSQDSAEGAGSDLLAILNESRRKKLKCNPAHKIASVDRVSESEKYMDLPASWTWTRIIEIGMTQTGTSPSSSNTNLFGEFVPFVKPADLDGDQINYDGPGLSKEGMNCSRTASKNTVLMVCIGATLGKVNVTDRTVCFNQQINSVTPYLDGLHRFLVLALKAPYFQKLAWSKASTATLPIISKRKWEVLPVPLPPLIEQHRIVAKVDELMVFCNRLEANLAVRDKILGNLLDTLLEKALDRS